MASRSDPGGEIQWLTTDEVLCRQVHPAQMKGTEPNDLAFRPMKCHQYTLSATRQWVGPERSYRQRLAQGLKSAGTWGISVEECSKADLDAFDDSALPGKPPGHVSIPFGTPPTDNEKDPALIAKARLLRNHAAARGCLYRHENVMPPTTFGTKVVELTIAVCPNLPYKKSSTWRAIGSEPVYSAPRGRGLVCRPRADGFSDHLGFGDAALAGGMRDRRLEVRRQVDRVAHLNRQTSGGDVNSKWPQGDGVKWPHL